MILTICDTETTGFSSISDKIVQIAYVNVDTNQNYKIIKSYNKYINYNLSYMPEGAYEAHGLSVDFLKENGAKPTDVADETYVDLCHSIFVGYNVAFDERMLNSFFYSTGYDNFHIYKTIDVMKGRVSLSQSLINHKIRNSTITAVNFNSKFNRAHDASWDVIATYLLMKRCKDELF